uniref:Uncharacterized protein n=1 Tax=Setaria viridis TaxID=4556 RepID=A0A4U6V210_SETVI|nr:hypothetical protein SEVIR_4G270800v2 [Setaria viridis]
MGELILFRFPLALVWPPCWASSSTSTTRRRTSSASSLPPRSPAFLPPLPRPCARYGMVWDEDDLVNDELAVWDPMTGEERMYSMHVPICFMDRWCQEY